MTTNVQRISDAEYAAALAAGRIEAETEIRAQAVRYVPERDALEIRTAGRSYQRVGQTRSVAGRIGD